MSDRQMALLQVMECSPSSQRGLGGQHAIVEALLSRSLSHPHVCPTYDWRVVLAQEVRHDLDSESLMESTLFALLACLRGSLAWVAGRQRSWGRGAGAEPGRAGRSAGHSSIAVPDFRGSLKWEHSALCTTLSKAAHRLQGRPACCSTVLYH